MNPKSWQKSAWRAVRVSRGFLISSIAAGRYWPFQCQATLVLADAQTPAAREN